MVDVDKNLLLEILKGVKHKIPEQGPLEYFVHHNTIHHYEDLNFFEAVKKAAFDFNSNAFMPEEFYIHKYNLRVIKHTDLINEINAFVFNQQLSLSPEMILRLLLDKTHKKTKEQREDIQAIQDRYYVEKPYFFSQILKEDLGVDIDFYAAPPVYRFLSAYFDYGSAYWLLENRKKGLWKNFCALHKRASLFENKYRKNVAKLVRQLEKMTPTEVIQFILNSLEITESHTHEYLFELCLKHKGWAGFVKSLEEHPEWIKCHDIVSSFPEFIAIALLCEYAAILSFSKSSLKTPRYKKLPLHSAEFLTRFFIKTKKYEDRKKELFQALPFLTDFNRQEIFHKAYEKSFYNMFLTAYTGKDNYIPEHPYAYQVVCCIDDREESFRRYLEVKPECETFGCAGHFGLNILYKGFFDKHYRALCPVNVKPDYKITEAAVRISRVKHKMLHLWGEVQWLSTLSSKTLIGGYFQALISGVLNTLPFILDVIDPRIIFQLKSKTQKHLKSSVSTRLVYKQEENKDLGISFESRLQIAETFLTMIGLTKEFSPFIFVMGHGSSSLNNPHEAAQDCGACGPGRGAPNGRLMACILNEPEIREGLKLRNIVIPSETKFIGSYHNTCSGDVEFFDIETLEHQKEVRECIQQIKTAAAHDARERCRRFNNLPLGKEPDYYLKYTQARAMDVRQPRPEYGHATNALCVIGPRSYSRKLFLDRRAFLISYSPEEDTNAINLKKLLNVVIPVCAGINLEYYFSFIDNEFYGSGTKLPHNVTALIGVINGYMSDLRLGLPWQMVEIHQPVRLFVTIISPLKCVEEMLHQENTFTPLIENEWINLAIHDPSTHKIWIYKNKSFEEYKTIENPPLYFQNDWNILNKRNHIDFGKITHVQ